MADEAKAGVVPQYPREELPTFFSDGVMNFHNSPQIAKFYFARFDPPYNLVGGSKSTLVCQIAMPLPAFVQTAAFFSAGVKSLISQGFVSQKDWDEAIAAQKKVEFNA